MQNRNRGDSHAIIIVVIILGILCALGYVFYTRFMAKAPTTANMSADQQALSQPKASTITEVAGTDMLRYSNPSLGFHFDFPKQTYGEVACAANDKWYDSYGTLVDAPVTWYGAIYGPAAMTILESNNTFTITQKRAPLFTAATYGADKRQYNSDCKMVDVTQQALDNRDLTVTSRAWQVYKVNSQDDIARYGKLLEPIRSDATISAIEYTLGTLQNGRQDVQYTVTYKNPDDGLTGGGASKTWYYSKQKLLVHIYLGQSNSFAKIDDQNSYYIDQIVDSFSVDE